MQHMGSRASETPPGGNAGSRAPPDHRAMADGWVLKGSIDLHDSALHSGFVQRECKLYHTAVLLQAILPLTRTPEPSVQKFDAYPGIEDVLSSLPQPISCDPSCASQSLFCGVP